MNGYDLYSCSLLEGYGGSVHLYAMASQHLHLVHSATCSAAKAPAAVDNCSRHVHLMDQIGAAQPMSG